jgi:hypothetical protein
VYGSTANTEHASLYFHATYRMWVLSATKDAAPFFIVAKSNALLPNEGTHQLHHASHTFYSPYLLFTHNAPSFLFTTPSRFCVTHLVDKFRAIFGK